MSFVADIKQRTMTREQYHALRRTAHAVLRENPSNTNCISYSRSLAQSARSYSEEIRHAFHALAWSGYWSAFDFKCECLRNRIGRYLEQKARNRDAENVILTGDVSRDRVNRGMVIRGERTSEQINRKLRAEA